MKHKSPTYKKIEQDVATCPKCGDIMIKYPFECSCGKWSYDEKNNEFEVINNESNNIT